MFALHETALAASQVACNAIATVLGLTSLIIPEDCILLLSSCCLLLFSSALLTVASLALLGA